MILEIIEKLTSLIEPIISLSKDRRELRDNALRSISHAINETHLYYKFLCLENQGERDMERESQLSKYWAAAAIPIRHFDEQLSMLCERKSEYWINPEQWSSEQIKEVGISLESVRNRYRELLHPKFKVAGKTSVT